MDRLGRAPRRGVPRDRLRQGQHADDPVRAPDTPAARERAEGVQARVRRGERGGAEQQRGADAGATFPVVSLRPSSLAHNPDTPRCLSTSTDAPLKSTPTFASIVRNDPQFDPTGAVADALEDALGVGFLRHSSKKPGGSCDALVRRFACEPSQMVMIGDRYMTDVVYGNRHGMLTIRCAPFTDAVRDCSPYDPVRDVNAVS
eukprot:22130-Pelagococcus_subviridis.AAC.1